MLDFRKEKSEVAVKAFLSREYDTRLPSNVQLHPVSSDVNCIAEGIDADLNSFDAIFIQAPTGFGKTHFIIHEVLPKVIQTGGKMLLVSNRVAVSFQQKLDILKAVHGDQNSLPVKQLLAGTSDCDFGPVRVLTLQSLDALLNSKKGQNIAKAISVLVVDEAH